MQIIYGIRALSEAITAGKTIEKVLIKKGTSGPLINDLINDLKSNKVHFLHVHADRFVRYQNKNHQGVVAYIAAVVYQDIFSIVQEVFEQGEFPLILACDGITDVRNFGAIARSASCFGVHALLITDKNTAEINSDAIKTSAGALNSMPVCKVSNLAKTIRTLQASGLSVVSASEKGNTLVYENNITGPTVLVMGSESEGISPDILKLSDVIAKIPIAGNIASLNVSVSAGILLYEINRQRNLATPL